MTKLSLITLSLSFGLCGPSFAASVATLAESFAPQGSAIARVPTHDAFGATYDIPAACAPNKSSQTEVAFAYSQSGVLYLQIGSVIASRVILLGTFLQTSEAVNGIACRDILRTNSPQVLALSSEGASVGSYLNIFSVVEGRLQALPGSPIGFYQLSVDCPDTKAACRIASYGKWTAPDSATADVYDWNGSAYILNSSEEQHYSDLMMERVRAQALEDRPMEAAYRSMLTLRASAILIAKGRRAEASSLLQTSLKILLDRSLTSGSLAEIDSARKTLTELVHKYSQ